MAEKTVATTLITGTSAVKSSRPMLVSPPEWTLSEQLIYLSQTNYSCKVDITQKNVFENVNLYHYLKKTTSFTAKQTLQIYIFIN